MREIRFHGRGGQGAVTSAELLAHAAIAAGKWAQAFPSFGPERRGAPVIAFARVDDGPIRNRTAIREPNIVVVLDPSLLRLVRVEEGLAPDGLLVVNSIKTPSVLRLEHGLRARLVVVDANRIANEEMGLHITNTTMLGAMLAGDELAPIIEVERAIEERFGPNAVKNVAAFRRGLREAVLEAPQPLEKILLAG